MEQEYWLHWRNSSNGSECREDYAQELAADCCEMPKDIAWPFTCIDWEQAARELQIDYTSVSFDGIDYWIRG